MKNLHAFFAIALLIFAAQTAQAQVISYNIFIDGDDSPVQILAPGTYALRVEAIVTENDLTGAGVFGGLLQSAFNLSDTAGAIVWEDITGGFIGGPNGNWDSIANPGFDAHFQGTLSSPVTVIAETSAVSPGDFTTQFEDFSANVFSVITEGNFTYDGSPTTLNLEAFTNETLVAALSGTNIVGAFPQAVNGDSIQLAIPEPGTFALASLGLISLVASRRRRQR